jgi:hypothetical protein
MIPGGERMHDRRPASRRTALVLTATALFALAGSRAGAGEFGVSLDGGYFDLTNARKSAQAVFDGTAGGFTGGGALRYSFARGFFVAAGARYFERTGERVFVPDADGPVFRLQHPLKVRMIPMYALVGYRLERRRGLPLVPYIGLGGGATAYHEESEIGGLTEGVLDQTKGAGYGVLGLEYGRGAVRFGVEMMYSLVPESAGLGGVTEVFGEDDLGGFTVVGKLTFVP